MTLEIVTCGVVLTFTIIHTSVARGFYHQYYYLGTSKINHLASSIPHQKNYIFNVQSD